MPNIRPETTRVLSPPLDLPKVYRILVVEDNFANQKVVSNKLRKSGHIVGVANHGEDALDFIRRSEY
jgi:CheY-like chemotaxis protein